MHFRGHPRKCAQTCHAAPLPPRILPDFLLQSPQAFTRVRPKLRPRLRAQTSPSGVYVERPTVCRAAHRCRTSEGAPRHSFSQALPHVVRRHRPAQARGVSLRSGCECVCARCNHTSRDQARAPRARVFWWNASRLAGRPLWVACFPLLGKHAPEGSDERVRSARQFARLPEVPTAAPGLRRAHSRATTSLARSESTDHFNDSSDHETCVARDIDRHSLTRVTELESILTPPGNIGLLSSGCCIGSIFMSKCRARYQTHAESLVSSKGLTVSSRGVVEALRRHPRKGRTGHSTPKGSS